VVPIAAPPTVVVTAIMIGKTPTAVAITAPTVTHEVWPFAAFLPVPRSLAIAYAPLSIPARPIRGSPAPANIILK
jgi:hypothetical protein